MGNDRIRIPEPEWSKNLWKRIKAMITRIDGEIEYITDNTIASISQNGTPLTPDANKNVNIVADANVINTVKQNGTALTPDGNKAVNIVADANVIEGISFNGSAVTPSNKQVSLTETDPTVPSWAKASSKPTYTASEVGALPASTPIPSKTSDLINDSGFITDSSIPYIPESAGDVGALRYRNFAATVSSLQAFYAALESEFDKYVVIAATINPTIMNLMTNGDLINSVFYGMVRGLDHTESGGTVTDVYQIFGQTTVLSSHRNQYVFGTFTIEDDNGTLSISSDLSKYGTTTASCLNIAENTLAGIYTKLMTIEQNVTATCRIGDTAVAILTGNGNAANGVVTVPVNGTVTRYSSSKFTFEVHTSNGANIYSWYSQLASDSSCVTSTVYQYSGTAI